MTSTERFRLNRWSMRRRAGAAGLLAAGAVTGGVLASTVGASAATGTSESSGSTATAPPNTKSATPVRSDEKEVTGSLAATLKAAALTAVPGGTVYRIETDAGDGVYEAHMTKADGTLVTVKFDASGKVTKVEDGMGTGDPAPAGAASGPSGQGAGGPPAAGSAESPPGG